MEISASKTYDAVIYAYERGYRVTDDGILLNPDGSTRRLNKCPSSFYPTITVYKDGGKYSVVVHKLAAYCFYGDAAFEKGKHVRHLNSEVFDISRSNLVMGTPKENIGDQPEEVRLLTMRKARDAAKKVLRIFTDDQVRDIRKQMESGVRGIDLARQFGVHKQTIYNINNRKRYADVI